MEISLSTMSKIEHSEHSAAQRIRKTSSVDVALSLVHIRVFLCTFSYFMGFCNPFLKLGLLSISDCISDFKVRHKKREKNQHFITTNCKSLRSFKVSEIFVTRRVLQKFGSDAILAFISPALELTNRNSAILRFFRYTS